MGTYIQEDMDTVQKVFGARNASLVRTLNQNQKGYREEMQIVDARLDGHDQDISIIKSAITQIQKKVFDDSTSVETKEAEPQESVKNKQQLSITKIMCTPYPSDPERIIIVMENPRKTKLFTATQQVYDEVIKPLQDAGYVSYTEQRGVPTLSSPDQSVSRAIHAEIAIKINHLPSDKNYAFKTNDFANLCPSNITLYKKKKTKKN